MDEKGMTTRRVQAIGKRSFVITLPKDWIVQNGIEPKTELSITESASGDLIISKGLQKKSTVARINIDKEASIRERLVFCYENNIDKIHLTTSSKLPYKVKSEVKQVVDTLEGYRIIDESKKGIEIGFLFKEVTITLPKIVRRMMYLLNLMQEALQEKDKQTLESSEQTVNKLYHLAARIIFACAHDSSMQAAHSVKSLDELFYWKDIVRRLEIISDRIWFIFLDGHERSDALHLAKLLEPLEQVLIHNADHTKAKKILEPLEYKAKDRAIDARLKRVHDVAIDIIHNVMDIRFGSL